MKTLRIAFALLALASAPALAGGHGEDDGHTCPMHDTTLTAEERAKAMDEMFTKLDADASGSISREEFDRHHEDMQRKHDGKAKDEHQH